jgi:hypothetical protein
METLANESKPTSNIVENNAEPDDFFVELEMSEAARTRFVNIVRGNSRLQELLTRTRNANIHTETRAQTLT